MLCFSWHLFSLTERYHFNSLPLSTNHYLKLLFPPSAYNSLESSLKCFYIFFLVCFYFFLSVRVKNFQRYTCVVQVCSKQYQLYKKLTYEEKNISWRHVVISLLLFFPSSFFKHLLGGLIEWTNEWKITFRASSLFFLHSFLLFLFILHFLHSTILSALSSTLYLYIVFSLFIAVCSRSQFRLS